MKKVCKLFCTVGIILCLATNSPPIAAASSGPIVNVPHFDGQILFSKMAIFWFGQITPQDNYVDVRMGYNNEELYVRLAAVDRWLWYQTRPSRDTLNDWDAATLYLSLNGNSGESPGTGSYRFRGQLSWWENPRDAWQSVDAGNGSAWTAATLPFQTESSWRGNAPNDAHGDHGWTLTFHIPFASLGLAGPPQEGTMWGIAMTLHDRDGAEGPPNIGPAWPQGLVPDRPATWAQMVFGLPSYTPPLTSAQNVTTIRHGLNGAVVPDAAVGGDTTCGGAVEHWNEWGNTNYAGAEQINIQNQSDISDWPCFSKYYVTFPLQSIPAGKTIISATLTMYQFGNSGQGWEPAPIHSYIQVLTTEESWEEGSITWNNGPQAKSNIAGTWVDPVETFPGWPGIASHWDVSPAVNEAYLSGEPLRLVLYSADSAMHSGKYFNSSDVEEWNARGRPTLTVKWGQAGGVLHQTVSPHAAKMGQNVSYSITFSGTGDALVLSDTLPQQLTAPLTIDVQGGPPASYEAGEHTLTWAGTPAAGETVRISFTSAVATNGPLAVTNRAVLSDAAGVLATSESVLIIDGFSSWLPILN